MKLNTKIIHSSKININTYLPPIVKSSTILFNNINRLMGNDRENVISYGIHNNLTIKRLEGILASIEGGKYVLITSSGLSSLYISYISIIDRYDIVLIPGNVYQPNIIIFKYLIRYLSVKVIIYNQQSILWDLIYRFKYFNIRLIVIESPGSITLKVANLKSLVMFSRLKMVISLIDNTYHAGFRFKALKYKIDIVVQAITKYQSGNNDVLMGAIITNVRDIYLNIIKVNRLMGNNVNSNDCYLVVRSITSTPLRLNIHLRNTRKIISWLNNNRLIGRVYVPKYDYTKCFKYYNRYYIKGSGLVSFRLIKDVKYDSVINFINDLNLFRIGYSWGGCISLIMLYRLKNDRSLVVRLSIGLESYIDLIKDLEQAMVKLSK